MMRRMLLKQEGIMKIRNAVEKKIVISLIPRAFSLLSRSELYP